MVAPSPTWALASHQVELSLWLRGTPLGQEAVGQQGPGLDRDPGSGQALAAGARGGGRMGPDAHGLCQRACAHSQRQLPRVSHSPAVRSPPHRSPFLEHSLQPHRGYHCKTPAWRAGQQGPSRLRGLACAAAAGGEWMARSHSVHAGPELGSLWVRPRPPRAHGLAGPSLALAGLLHRFSRPVIGPGLGL